MKRTFSTCLALLLCWATFTACSKTKTVHTAVFESKSAQVEVIHETVSGGLTVKRGYRHPAVFEAETIRTAMQNLSYADPVFLWKEKERPIFNNAELDQLVPEITKAFAQANADQMIAFSIKSWKKDMIFGSDKITTGRAFIDEKGMNWVFGNVNLTEGQDGEVDRGNPMLAPPKNVRLALHAPQTFYVPVSPSWYEAKVFENWLIDPAPVAALSGSAVLAAPVPSEAPAADSAPKPVAETKTSSPHPVVKSDAGLAHEGEKPAPAPKTSSKNKAATDHQDDSVARLRRLKSMLDEKLISPQDYEIKKKEILKDL